MAACFKNPLLGIMNFMQFWFSTFLFMGLMVPEENVIWPFRALCSLSPSALRRGPPAQSTSHGGMEGSKVRPLARSV